MPSYCPVYPHLLATFTIISTLPLYSARSTSLPVIDFILKSSAPLGFSCPLADATHAATTPANSSPVSQFVIVMLLVYSFDVPVCRYRFLFNRQFIPTSGPVQPRPRSTAAAP